MITIFGKFTRKLRIDRGEILKNMADKLSISSAFLSAIETGRKNIPADFEEKIITSYQLDPHQSAEIRTAADRSRSVVQINPQSDLQKDVVGAMARKMNAMSDADLAKIFQLLKKS